MKRIIRFSPLLFFSLLLISCGPSKKVIPGKESLGAPEVKINTSPNLEPEDNRAYTIIEKAKDFLGTDYKYGGTTKRGMDCSGLIYISFMEEGVSLPRISRNMALEGRRLHLKEVSKGDLLFFETNKNRKVINHVGLVVEVLPEHILFIHSSSSRGVMISSLSESYWYNNFVMARRVL
ncbi:C40 family peptidase [Salegentibacter chungangensis]|uniref:C40 family peptidase n=1 Tax=Salegentibacter chungangensis TaxID=1335724 RepID=A0ABW3NKR0_9FLAO